MCGVESPLSSIEPLVFTLESNWVSSLKIVKQVPEFYLDTEILRHQFCVSRLINLAPLCRVNFVEAHYCHALRLTVICLQ